MKRYQIVILAGGLGTRLLPTTETTPKVLAQVADRPFIFWQLNLIAASKIDEVILCVGFLSEQVEATVGNAYRGISVKYSYEPPDRLLGTAGAIKNAEPLLDNTFGVLYGDSYLEIDYRSVFESHRKSRFPVMMTIWRNEGKCDTSNVVLSEDGKRVVCYEKNKKPNTFHYIDYGFSIFDKNVILSRLRMGEPASLDHVQRDLVMENLLGAYEVHNRFYEIGSKSGLAELEQYLKSCEPKASLCDYGSNTS